VKATSSFSSHLFAPYTIEDIIWADERRLREIDIVAFTATVKPAVSNVLPTVADVRRCC